MRCNRVKRVGRVKDPISMGLSGISLSSSHVAQRNLLILLFLLLLVINISAEHLFGNCRTLEVFKCHWGHRIILAPSESVSIIHATVGDYSFAPDDKWRSGSE